MVCERTNKRRPKGFRLNITSLSCCWAYFFWFVAETLRFWFIFEYFGERFCRPGINDFLISIFFLYFREGHAVGLSLFFKLSHLAARRARPRTDSRCAETFLNFYLFDVCTNKYFISTAMFVWLVSGSSFYFLISVKIKMRIGIENNRKDFASFFLFFGWELPNYLITLAPMCMDVYWFSKRISLTKHIFNFRSIGQCTSG